ncbi:sigma-70 family RNA polymerase sigma factor [Sulfobacillus thermosulfidooxidans]|uniref:sigma-70 family RNA polymerase sigma factor n=1 Tax=Sulfobacillus thermosulfidooxidans TaxID=28034 RepID=UPI0009E84A1D|nr:sigma-70 family RNA polymerase sigma factor [Sulfobacillus thermosulfidooxidans]
MTRDPLASSTVQGMWSWAYALGEYWKNGGEGDMTNNTNNLNTRSARGSRQSRTLLRTDNPPQKTTEEPDEATWHQWIARAQAGDEAVWASIFAAADGFIRRMLRAYYWPGFDSDRNDGEQIARIGVWQAVMQYQPTRQIPVRAWVRWVVRRRLADGVRQATRHKQVFYRHALRLDSPWGTGGETNSPLVTGHHRLAADACSDPLQWVERLEERNHLYEGMEALTAWEWQVLWDVVDGLSYGEIARLRRRHPKAVDNALQRARRKLRQYWELDRE